jgi:hypothetical protein
MIKSRFFSKKDEVILSTATLFVVIALMYQGFASLLYTKEHAIFHNCTVASKK